jgi:D-arabinono-1,4-lactone oxidase/FAD binding domain
MSNNSSSAPTGSAPTWENWSRNIVHSPPSDGENYYFTPTNLSELKAVLAAAVQQGVKVRVSGQRHSQPPLVIADNRGVVTAKPAEYLVDMSCYADLGPNGDQTMVVDKVNRTITVNVGVREDAVDAFLTQNNLMFKTVTAGGFFSLGGMTVVDVHGATVDDPIFAETVSSFTILGADGTVRTIDASTPPVNGWSPLQFARVSLGGLGIVTSITIDVLDRPWATTLQGGTAKYGIKDKQQFINQYQQLLTSHTRVESFFNPYADNIFTKSFLVLYWDVVDNPANKIPNKASTPASACTLAGEGDFGAPFLTPAAVEFAAEVAAQTAQAFDSSWLASPIVVAAFANIEGQAEKADSVYSDLWLAQAARVMFMSYFVELPNIDSAGLGKAWDGLDVVAQIVKQNGNFHIAAPLEFRFIKGGNSAMSGTYCDDPDNTYFINYDLIGFVPPTASSGYPADLLKFFADVEQQWVAMGGFPHNGKMYGFYDPNNPGSATPAFNSNYLAALRQRRGARLVAFNQYRQSCDPNGVFYNTFLRQLLQG